MNKYPIRAVRTREWKYIRNLDPAAEHHTHVDKAASGDGRDYWDSWAAKAKTDASHVRNAVARFDQVKGVTDEERDQAFANIRAAAKHYDVEVAEDNWRQLGKRLLLTVRDLMRTGPRNPVVRITASMKDLFSEITEKHLGAVSVVDDTGALVGLVTDYDIRRAVGEGLNIFSMTIPQIMNPHPVAIAADDKAVQALKIMEEREKPLAVLPVIEGNRLVCGMIHLHDLVDKGL